MVEDTPDDLVMELFAGAFWPNHPLGRPILGTRRTVGRFRREDLASYFARVYHPANMLIAAAGHLEHGGVAALVGRHFAGLHYVVNGSPAVTRPLNAAEPGEARIPRPELGRPTPKGTRDLLLEHGPEGLARWALGERRLLFTGDAVANNFGLRPPMGWYTEDMAQAKESIRKLAQLDFEVACFGHGPPLDRDASLAFRRLAERLR